VDDRGTIGVASCLTAPRVTAACAMPPGGLKGRSIMRQLVAIGATMMIAAVFRLKEAIRQLSRLSSRSG